MRVFILLFITLLCATQAIASTYLQRFRVSPKSERAEEIIRKADYLVGMYPWLANFKQPTALLKTDAIKHRLSSVHEVIPDDFYSNERTIISYADGVEVTHLQVSPPPHFYDDYEDVLGFEDMRDNANYRQIKRLYWDKKQPAIVSIANPDGRVQGEFVYIERGVNHLHNIYSPAGFRFEHLLAEVETPILNIAPGGYHFSWTLTKLNSELQQERPRAERKHIHVFNIDLSGSYQTFTTNPFYLFGDMYDTGLPDDAFGAVLALGGPLNRKSCPWDECIGALREMARVAAPDGRLLIEFRLQPVDMLLLLEESGVSYSDVAVYERLMDYTKYKGRKITRLLDVRL